MIQENSMCSGKTPRHIAMIMDGNGRWAQEKGLERSQGHRKGVDTVKKMVEACGEKGVDYLTLYAFSSENWKRPQEEVNILMALMVDAIVREGDELMEQNVSLRAIGNLKDLPTDVKASLDGLIQRTSENTGVKMVLALSYGARWEILNAVRALIADVEEGKLAKELVTEGLFAHYLTTKGIPDPDLLIRTGGEYRLSNFLLWQSAYTELYFVDKFWPDFEKEDLYLAIHNFSKRERRFGKTGEQLKEN